MNYQIKESIVNSLIKVVESAPDIYLANNRNQPKDYLEQQFKNWLDYVNSVLDIAYEYARLYEIIMTKTKVLQLSQTMLLEQKIYAINSEILNLAKIILQY